MCSTIPSAHAAEAMHKKTKLAYHNTGKSAMIKSAALTSVQQAHLFILNSQLNEMKNTAVYNAHLKTGKNRHDSTLVLGRQVLLHAWHLLFAFEMCQDENQYFIIEETTGNNADNTVNFVRQESQSTCPFHEDWKRRWKYRENNIFRKNYKKERKGQCACVQFYTVNEDGEEQEVEHDSYWCEFNDEPAHTVTNVLTEAETQQEEAAVLENTEFGFNEEQFDQQEFEEEEEEEEDDDDDD
jgi:hypothetical protein